MGALKTKPDKNPVVWQECQIRDIEEKLAQEFPRNREKIKGAIELCKDFVRPTEGQDLMIECVRSMLK